MTSMRDETISSPSALDEFLRRGLPAAWAAGEAIGAAPSRRIEVLGRGSSSHAGTVVRYAFAGTGYWRVSAAMPSTVAKGVAAQAWADTTLLAISQSGRSPDLVRYAQVVGAAGARVISLVNAEDSPLAAAAAHRVPLCVGPERAVAATKSVMASIVAGLAVLAGTTANEPLRDALQALPEQLRAAAGCDWSALGEVLPTARAMYVVGRGVDLGIAKELALKMAEAVGVPALAFSSAEFLHGPVGAVSAATPVLGLISSDEDIASVLEALARARARGARTLLAHGLGPASGAPAPELALPRGLGVAAVDAVTALMPAYLAIETASLAVGRDPDRPAGLAKVTETL